jgi:hypothetical protein
MDVGRETPRAKGDLQGPRCNDQARARAHCEAAAIIAVAGLRVSPAPKLDVDEALRRWRGQVDEPSAPSAGPEA